MIDFPKHPMPKIYTISTISSTTILHKKEKNSIHGNSCWRKSNHTLTINEKTKNTIKYLWHQNENKFKQINMIAMQYKRSKHVHKRRFKNQYLVIELQDLHISIKQDKYGKNTHPSYWYVTKMPYT